MTLKKPIIVSEADLPFEQWQDAQKKGSVRWKTIFGGATGPTVGVTCGIAEIASNLGVAGLKTHHHQEDEVYYIIAGCGSVTIDGARYPVSAGTAVFIPGNAKHSIKNDGLTPLKLYYSLAANSFKAVEYIFEEENDVS